MVEKSVSFGPPQSSDRICGSFSAYHHKNRRVERHARMAIGTFSFLTIRTLMTIIAPVIAVIGQTQIPNRRRRRFGDESL